MSCSEVVAIDIVEAVVGKEIDKSFEVIQILFERFASRVVGSGIFVGFDVNVHAMGFVACEQF